MDDLRTSSVELADEQLDGMNARELREHGGWFAARWGHGTSYVGGLAERVEALRGGIEHRDTIATEIEDDAHALYVLGGGKRLGWAGR